MRWFLVAVALVAGGLVATAPAAHAVDDAECDQTTLDETFATTRDSGPLAEMDVDRAHDWLARRGQGLGAGVVVAVVDSGVGATAGVDVVEQPVVVPGLERDHYHGTAVAGLVAGSPRQGDAGGPVGIAPDAQILDLQVFDDPTGDNGTPILTANVVAALDVVLARRAAGMNVRVVNISLNVAPDEALAQRVQQLWDAGVVTVAGTGNRPRNDPGDTGSALVPDEQFEQFRPGEDARDVVHPAAYDPALGVNASMAGLSGADPHEFVLENSATDVAAPTAGAVSYTVNGGTCLLSTPATSWAAAEVSGVLALLFAHFPDDTPAMAVSRLLLTADGRADIPDRLAGAGDVQVYDALTRPLALDESGAAEQTRPEPDTQVYAAPEPEPDVLASTRRDAVWWGLLGGGALLLALVLRPVLARRRTR
ncbi:S8 family serine peptidase [Nocardioides sp.]|uniref:S8 family serine peptidase n=1 Tax=Nocardioides sp. TaxID=35761 RepID=UPI001A265474|nr:S8 family serine peptidase [Nocardioides sp.]MBJ7359588.1 S8 family serine peptidase [Nocardioides sp.]